MALLSPKELRSRRLAVGMTRQQLAAKIGVSTELISAWEAGEAPIDHVDALNELLQNPTAPKPRSPSDH